MTDLAIDIHDLRKVYRDGWFGRRRIDALRGVSFDVPRGQIFGLLGANGAGKTTIIKVLLGIVRKSGGAASMLGKSVGHRATRRRVGYLPENHRIPRHHTGNTALEYYGMLSGLSGAEVRRRRPQLLELVGLAEWGRTPVRKYSKGMQQRLGLAQAMLHDPELLILDEPTDGVDPVGRANIRTILLKLKGEGKTVFINSHLLQEVQLVCDRVVMLDHGLVTNQGTISELTARRTSEAVLMVIGTDEVVRAALGGLNVCEWNRPSPEVLRVAVDVPTQLQLDQCIDRLRQAGVSIDSIERRRLTLEEVFLETIVKAEQV